MTTDERIEELARTNSAYRDAEFLSRLRKDDDGGSPFSHPELLFERPGTVHPEPKPEPEI